MAEIIQNSDYKQWLSELKLHIRQSQIKAAVRVNTEMLELYWSIGADIVAKLDEHPIFQIPCIEEIENQLRN
ncbi:hypothetical protein AGMMS49574_21130 [Bacteroidia bacterium]|nr:hypothetical protein AGMMS49574_21130 [Bacteroidia bacterium]